MPASILLLDPYRSAIAARGISEKILSPSTKIDVTKTSTWMVGNNRRLQATVMQFVTLFDDVLLVQNEEAGDAERLEERGSIVKPLSLLPFTHMELVRFAKTPIDALRNETVKNAGSVMKIWSIEKNLLDTWEPFVIPLLLLKHVIPHASIYHFLRAVRLGDNDLIQQTIGKVPQEFADYVTAIFEPDINVLLNLDFVVFSTLSELIATEKIVAREECRVAHMPFEKSFHKQKKDLEQKDDPETRTKTIFKVVIEELLAERFFFPVPNTLSDVQKLRRHPDIAAFRETFQPWLNTLAKGDLKEEKRLRKEVKKTIKKFQRAPGVKRMTDVMGLIAIPLGLAPVKGAVDAVNKALGALLGVGGIGFPKLAERWQEQGKWVSLCKKSDGFLNINYPDF